MSKDRAVILVMGPVKSGKTTFVNLASGSNFPVEAGFKTETRTSKSTESFTVAVGSEQQEVILVDTPGLILDDGSKLTNIQALRNISDHLKRYQDKEIEGLICLISACEVETDFKKNCSEGRKLFRKRVASNTEPDSLSSVAIVATSLDKVAEHLDVRKGELEKCFRKAVGKGATIICSYQKNDQNTTHEIIAKVLEKKRPLIISPPSLWDVLLSWFNLD